MIGGPGVVVEVDETFIGGVKNAAVKGRSPYGKAIVAIAVEAHDKGAGRVRLARIPDTKAGTLLDFIFANVQPASIVHTDGYHAYDEIRHYGYVHRVTNMSAVDSDAAHVAMPHAHRSSPTPTRQMSDLRCSITASARSPRAL
jgi:transposase-like protein